jgi:voltage-gated potassium channel
MTSALVRLPEGWLAGGLNLVAVLLLFFTLPVQTTGSTARLVVNILLSVAGVVVVCVVLVKEAREHGPLGGRRGGVQLFLLFEIVVVIFAFSYYVLAVRTTSQMYGLDTRMDSLYFTMSMMTTVGFGDIHASGQFARGLATVNMAFNIVFIAAVGGLVKRRIRQRHQVEGIDDD